jgi:hypothetical protein
MRDWCMRYCLLLVSEETKIDGEVMGSFGMIH